MKVVAMSIREANDFVRSYHRHNKPVVGAKFAIGASDGHRLMGVAIVGRCIARHLDIGDTAEVARCCVLDDAQKGACSFLYSRCWRVWAAMGGKRLVTYTLASESGASLRGAGWRIVGQVPVIKAGWQRADRSRDWQSVYGQTKLRWEA